MDGLTRRRFLTTSTAAIAASAAGGLLQSGQAETAPLKDEPEKGATLRVLRWKRFVRGDEDQLLANTRRFTELTGVEVRIDSENVEELRPKAAVAAEVGAGPDIIISTDEQPQLYPDKLVDVSELANYLGQKYGGWFEICPEDCTHEGRWIAIPTGVNGSAMVYRKSMLRAAGFEQFPKDLPGFLKLCQALKAKGTPSGFALGHATATPTGGELAAVGVRRTVDEREERLALNSNETIAALEYAKELYQTFVPGTLSWLDPNNNKAFLAGEISLTMNGISIYYTAKTSPDSNLKAMVPDIQHADFPIGRIGKQVHGAAMFPGAIYKDRKYPNAAKKYLRFIMEREQYEPWQRASIGYISHTLRAYDSNPVWTDDPQHMFFRDLARGARHAGYAGRRAKNRRRYSPTSSSSTCSARSAPDSRPQRRRRSAPRNARGGTIGVRAHLINVIPRKRGSRRG